MSLGTGAPKQNNEKKYSYPCSTDEEMPLHEFKGVHGYMVKISSEPRSADSSNPVSFHFYCFPVRVTELIEILSWDLD